MKLKRSSGLLLHISSLPGKYGIGTMGAEAREFIGHLKQTGQHYWQILPLNPVSPIFGGSPYSSDSSFAGNPLLIDLEQLQAEPWAHQSLLTNLKETLYGDFIDFEAVIAVKTPLLQKFATAFFKNADNACLKDFHDFCQKESSWLDDYTLFRGAAEYYKSCNWTAWEPELQRRTPEAMNKWRHKLRETIDYHKFLQFIFFKQWLKLKSFAHSNDVQIIGDIPIYVTFDSADTWANPEIFQVDPETMRPVRIAGVPPDYFSKTGQRWGNPLYCWFENNEPGILKAETINWWTRRFAHALELFDVVRIDHFRGFESYWAIPEEEETAINGVWEPGPGVPFFSTIAENLGKSREELPVIAEDLGMITPAVEKLRDELGFPGMKVLQFAFDYEPTNSYLPHNFTTPNCVVYTGTHDNNTTNGWFYENETDEARRVYILDYMGLEHRHEFHWRFIRLGLSSIADLAIVPVQDLLGYAGKFRLNTPGLGENNWKWKLTPKRLTPEILERFYHMCKLYRRA